MTKAATAFLFARAPTKPVVSRTTELHMNIAKIYGRRGVYSPQTCTISRIPLAIGLVDEKPPNDQSCDCFFSCLSPNQTCCAVKQKNCLKNTQKKTFLHKEKQIFTYQNFYISTNYDCIEPKTPMVTLNMLSKSCTLT